MRGNKLKFFEAYAYTLRKISAQLTKQHAFFRGFVKLHLNDNWHDHRFTIKLVTEEAEEG